MLNLFHSIITRSVKMYHIAIVEDEKEFREQLKEYLQQYGVENQIEFQITEFADGAEIVENYKNEYDVILLDIEMPKLIKVQKDSYDWFVEEGLGEVLKDISPIIDYTGNLVLEFFDY